MQFNLALLTSALLVAVSPVLGADFVWFSGAGCTGSVIARSPGVTPGECVWLTNGGSAKSISYSGVPNHANFFESGGAHDVCSNGATIVTGGGSGCATGPAGAEVRDEFGGTREEIRGVTRGQSDRIVIFVWLQHMLSLDPNAGARRSAIMSHVQLTELISSFGHLRCWTRVQILDPVPYQCKCWHLATTHALRAYDVTFDPGLSYTVLLWGKNWYLENFHGPSLGFTQEALRAPRISCSPDSVSPRALTPFARGTVEGIGPVNRRSCLMIGNHLNCLIARLHVTVGISELNLISLVPAGTVLSFARTIPGGLETDDEPQKSEEAA
ncbi:hypothetical protein FB45DRAFT_868677 [Roridomyces roridus]|uniref:Uncharacterized protein n=1 Tax=Roridomyces roridus TaxID=1738132 RepID=A0AAD7BQI8_9AGAR|nr:hypothetical protein FB45DRAFT_868677 [Roridomyces roridus]